MSIIAKVRRRLSRRGYYDDPAQYWNRRHESQAQNLDGVGCLGLGDDGNAQDYEVKTGKIDAIIDGLGLGADARVLDAGCGIGVFSEHLASRGMRVEGRDFSAEAVALARERLGDRASFAVSPIDEIRTDEPYGLVVCIDVLFHIVDDDLWQRSVGALGAAIAPGGHVLIQDSLVDQRDARVGASHVRWRTLDEYRSAAAAADLDLVEHVRYDLPAEARAKDLLLFGGAQA